MNPSAPQLPASAGAFPETRWSLVLDAGNQRGRAALNELCIRYWFPAYATVRRCGHDPASAQRLTSAFFRHLDASALRQRATQVPRFRDYLRDSLIAFLAQGGPATDLALAPPVGAPGIEALEQRLQADGAARSPESTFESSFANEVIAQALARLGSEAAHAGRHELFALLEAYLARDPHAGEYELLAERAGLRPMTLAMALKRLRSRFRELVDEELAQTLDDPATLTAERAALLAAMEGGR